MNTVNRSRVTRVTDELAGARIKSRRLALGLSLRAMAEESGVHRTTLTRIESGAPGVEEHSMSRVLATLDRLEHRYGLDDPSHTVSVIELPDGSRVTFTGSPDGVAEAAARFLASRDTDE